MTWPELQFARCAPVRRSCKWKFSHNWDLWQLHREPARHGLSTPSSESLCSFVRARKMLIIIATASQRAVAGVYQKVVLYWALGFPPRGVYVNAQEERKGKEAKALIGQRNLFTLCSGELSRSATNSNTTTTANRNHERLERIMFYIHGTPTVTSERPSTKLI